MQNNNSIHISLCFLVLIVLSTSCKKDIIEPTSSNCEEAYVLFGHFYGECAGEVCIEIYRICESTLFEDSNDHYPSEQAESYDGDFQISSNQENYEGVKDLINQSPNQLLNETEKIIGQPDAGDWGGYYFEIKKSGKAPQFWLIDTKKDNLPAYLRDYTDKIAEAIVLINE